MSKKKNGKTEVIGVIDLTALLLGQRGRAIENTGGGAHRTPKGDHRRNRQQVKKNLRQGGYE